MIKLFQTLLPVGAPAPDFHMLDQTGRTVHLADHLGEAARARGCNGVVLVFYPADFTPVCTGQLCEFRDHWQRLQSAGLAVFGVNPFDYETHQRFAEKHGFPFPLLFDPKGRFARRYQVDIIRGFVHRRAVYGIGTDGRICFAQPGKPSVATVLAAFDATQPVA
ncbi:MAG: peroxiredoxin [Candidatus Melainabacteria bacterium]